METKLSQEQITSIKGFTPEQVTRYNRFRTTGFTPQESLSLIFEPTPSNASRKKATEKKEDGIIFGKNSLLSSVVEAGGDALGGFGKVFDDTQQFGVGQALLQSPIRVGGGVSRGFGTAFAGVLETADDLTGETVSGVIQEPLQRALETDTAKDVIGYLDRVNQDNRGLPADILEILGTATGVKLLQAPFRGVKTATRSAGRSLSDYFKPTVDDIPPPPGGNSGGVIGGILDTGAGVAQQGTEFVTRTVRGARDTAERSRRIANLPEPEAKLIRTGADETVINVIKQAPAEEASIYKKLVDQAKAKELDPTPNTPQPKQIAGQEFLKPVTHLLERRNAVGGALGDIRKKLSTSKTINTNPFFKNFDNYLREDLGLEINSKGQIRQGVGRIADSDISEIQKIYSELRSKTFASQKEIDEFLQRTFKEYDLRQAREQTFSDDVTRVAERARAEMRIALPDEYNVLSTQYAEIMKPISDMAKLLGYKGDLSKLTAKELKAGEVALRMLGNAADRPQSVINDVIRVAKDQGYESNIDLNRLIYITDQLEDLYDITPSRGFSGSTSRGVDQSGIGTLGDAATLNIGGLFNRAMSSRATREEVKEAFETFINSLGKTDVPDVPVIPTAPIIKN